MSFASTLTAQDLFGLFELNASGTVLYSRLRRSNELINSNPEWVGRNYFDEIASFENIEELRQMYKRFITNRQVADNFIFNCRFSETVVPVKVLMARTYEVNYGERANIVIMDIRKFDLSH